MDTTLVTTVTHTSVFRSVQDSLDAMHWLLMLLGWFLYWLKTINTVRVDCNGQPYMRKWAENNLIEIPTSMLYCIVVAIIAPEIPTDLIDLKGKVAVFMVGYTGGSVLNSIITNLKPIVKKSDNSIQNQ